MIFLLNFSLWGCYTAEMAQNPDGSWYETGRQVSTLPSVEHVRSYKDIRFPVALQKQLIDYRSHFGIWPYTIEGFMQESILHNDLINSLYKEGYKDMLFVSQSDTLLIYFNFAAKSIKKYNTRDEDEVTTNLIPSVWKYYPSTDGNFGFEQDLYVDY